MSELFVKDKIIPDHILNDIRYDIPHRKSFQSKISGYNDLDLSIRNSTERFLDYREYPDLCKILENFCGRIHYRHEPDTLKVKELHHLQYGIGGHFDKHHDVVRSKRIRRFSTITLLSKTNNLKGGDLIVFDEDENSINTNLKVGETVVFYSSTLHQVTPITEGGREVLVGWIFDR